MAPSPTVLDRAEAIHSALIQAGRGGKQIERHTVELCLVQRLRLPPSAVRHVIDAGRMAGLWTLVDRRPWPSLLQVHDRLPTEKLGQPINVEAV